MHSPDELRAIFKNHFGAAPSFGVRAPGRVNLIGEHIDYSGGLVLPMAIEKETRLVATPRTDGRYILRSLQFEEIYDGPLPSSAITNPKWVNYVFGVVHEFMRDKLVPQGFGFEAVFDGNVPLASGLSSSAALEVATAWFLHRALGAKLRPMELAVLSQRAEHNFVGVKCGIMDQGISACGAQDAAVRLDCATLETERIPIKFEGGSKFLIVHSGVHRGLSGSAYNERRSACDEALARISKASGKSFPNLCAVSLDELERFRGALDELLYKRALHAISEQARVKEAEGALKRGDARRFGELLNASHESLRVLYEVSIPELDELTGWLRSQDGVYGSRLTGAGFGGSTVSLVEGRVADALLDKIPGFFAQHDREMSLAFYTTAAPGASDL